MLNLSQIGQIGRPVSDVDRSEAFYENVVGCASCSASATSRSSTVPACACCSKSPRRQPSGCIYFRCADIALAVAELAKRGAVFTSKPHLIAKMDDHDLWMAFFNDPDGHTLALMQEAPKGYTPPA